MTSRIASQLVLGVSTALLLSGCYRYAPTTLDVVPVGAKVRAMLSIEEQAAVRDRTGMDMRLLEGELVEKGSEQVLLSVRSADASTSFAAMSLYQRIDVSRQGIVRVDAREIDPLKTAGLVAVVGGVAAFAVAQIFADDDPGRTEPPDGGPQDGIRAPFLKVPLIRF